MSRSVLHLEQRLVQTMVQMLVRSMGVSTVRAKVKMSVRRSDAPMDLH